MRAAVLKASLAFLVLFALLAAGGRALAQSWLPKGLGLGGETIALINIEGLITSAAGGGGLLGAQALASSVSLAERLYEARDDASVRAVVLRVDSPGGSAAASDEIYSAVMALRKVKPVVVSMGDVAASGGYYISSAATRVYANGATLTGSIGVIMNLMNWQELARKVGVADGTLTAGTLKDMGSPWRVSTPQERELFQQLLSQVHEQFIKAVDAGRDNLDLAAVRKLADGRVYTGEQALKAGLVDELGGLHEAVAKARELAQVPADTPLEEYGASGVLEQLLGVRARGGLAETLSQSLGGDALTLLSRGLYLNATLRDLTMR